MVSCSPTSPSLPASRSRAVGACSNITVAVDGSVQLAETIDSAATGLDHIHEAAARGRGMVLALLHSGNWDLAGVWIVQRAGTPTVVAERLQPESLFRRFVRFREGLGFEIVPLTGGTLRHRWNS